MLVVEAVSWDLYPGVGKPVVAAGLAFTVA
jgi:hypothetical protein